MKYATMKNYRNRMRQILLLALLVLSGKAAFAANWPTATGIQPTTLSTSKTYYIYSSNTENTGTGAGTYKFYILENNENPATYNFGSATEYEYLSACIINGGGGTTSNGSGIHIKLVFNTSKPVGFVGFFCVADGFLELTLGDYYTNTEGITLKRTGNWSAYSNSNFNCPFTIPDVRVNFKVNNVVYYNEIPEVTEFNYNETEKSLDAQKIIITGNPPLANEVPSGFTPANDTCTFLNTRQFVIDGGHNPTVTFLDNDSTDYTVSPNGTPGKTSFFRVMCGTLQLTNVTLQNYYSEGGNAGGIYVITNSSAADRKSAVKLEMEHCWMHHVANGWPGIYLQYGSGILSFSGSARPSATLKRCKFSENYSTSKRNGAIRSHSNGWCDLTMDKCTIYKNIGGGVRWQSTRPCTATFNNCHIKRNRTYGTASDSDKSQGSGGGMIIKSSAIINGCLIEKNWAQRTGGGIYFTTFEENSNDLYQPVHGDLKFDIDQSKGTTVIQYNRACEHGGGVAIMAHKMGPRPYYYGFTNGVMDGQYRMTFTLNGATIQNNTALTGDGGGVYISRGADATFYSLTCNLNKGTIKNNVAAGNGGGVCITQAQNSSGDPFVLPTYSTDINENYSIIPLDVTVNVSTGGAEEEMLIEDNIQCQNGGGIYVDVPEINYYAYNTNYQDVTARTYITVYDYANVYNNTASISGGGLYLKKGAVSIIREGETHRPTIQKNTATSGDGGGVYLYEGNITMDNATIGGSTTDLGNTAGNSGGGIFVNSGSIGMVSTIVQHNKAMNGSGGGMYLGGGNVSINPNEIGTGIRSSISNNTAGQHGGGVYTGNGKLIAYGSFSESGAQSNHIQITNNKASSGNGGGIYCQGASNSQSWEYDIRLRRVTIGNNEAGGSGGGIYLHKGKISVIDGAINGNTATANGGGVYTEEGNIDINATRDERFASEIIGNTAGINGGGLNTHKGYIRVFGTSKDQRIPIANNKADTGSGGGIFCMGKDAFNQYITLQHSDLINNKAVKGGGNAGTNVTAGCGGGMYLQKGKIAITDVNLQNNYAKNNGGGINNHEGSIDVDGCFIGSSHSDGGSYYCDTTLTYNPESPSNTDRGNKAGNNGGGIYTHKGDIDIEDYVVTSGNIFREESKITFNEAGKNGGGINTHMGTISINTNEDDDQIEVAFNKAERGGGMYANAGTIIVYNTLIHDNTATLHGGGANNHSGDIVIYGGILTNNTAKEGHGGGAYTYVGDIDLFQFPSTELQNATLNHGTKVFNNIAKLNGGAFNNHTGRIDIRHATIQNNTSTLGNGGAVFCEGPHANANRGLGYTIRLLCSDMVQNKTLGQDGTATDPTGRGGGIYLKYGSIYAHYSNILDNEANINGGGMDNHSGDILLYGCDVRGNRAKEGGGGGIFTYSGDITTGPSTARDGLFNTSKYTIISNNTAEQDGGGINNQQGNITINGDIVANNTSTKGNGGGIYITDGIINMKGGRIDNNQAPHSDNEKGIYGKGGGVYSGGGEFNIMEREANPAPIVLIVDSQVKRVTGGQNAIIHYHLVDQGKYSDVTNVEHGIVWGEDSPSIEVVYGSAAGINDGYSYEQGEPACQRITIPAKATEPTSVGIEANKTYKVKAFFRYKTIENGAPVIKTGYSQTMEFVSYSSNPLVISGAVSNITSTSAEGNGRIMDPGDSPIITPNGRGVEIWEVDDNGNMIGSAQRIPSTDETEFFTVNTTELHPDKTYKARAYATNSNDTGYGNTVEFKTLKNTPDMGNNPVIVTTEIVNGEIVATAEFSMPTGTTFGGTNGVKAFGFVWSTDDDPELLQDHTVQCTQSSMTNDTTFTASYSPVRPNLTFYVRAYASYIETSVTPTSDITNYSVSEATQHISPSLDGSPVVRANSISNITQNGANIHGQLHYQGSTAVTEYGVVYSPNIQEPAIPTGTATDPKKVSVSGSPGTTEEFTVPISGLTPGTTYYLRVYAVNAADTAYSNNFNFTALPISRPNVIIVSITDIDKVSAKVNFTINNGGGNISDSGKGVNYSLNSDMSGATAVNSDAITYDATTGVYSASLSGLDDHKTYYVQAYATNSAGTHTCQTVSFQTDFDKPSVVLNSLTNLTSIALPLTSDAVYTVTPYSSEESDHVKTYGICWSTLHNPTRNNSDVANTHFQDGTGGDITTATPKTTSMTQRFPNTRYWARAYASTATPNDNTTDPNPENHTYSLADIVYSDEKAFLTLPIMESNGASNVTSTSATLAGNIASRDPEHYLIKYGVCWGTSANPMPNNNPTAPNYQEYDITSATSTTRSFSFNATGLTPSTEYYYRTYAINRNGTSGTGYDYTAAQTNIAYGPDVTFATTAYTITAVALPSMAGTVTGGGGYNSGDQCTLTASTPTSTDYAFQSWYPNSGTDITDNPFVFPVTGNANYEARYKSKVTITAGEHGKVSFTGLNDEGWNNLAEQNTDNAMYDYNGSCTVYAKASAGYTFVNWTDADGNEVSTSANYTFTVTNVTNLTANFTSRGRGASRPSRPRDIYPAPAREPWDWDDDPFGTRDGEPTVPTVTTGAVTGVTATTATVAGTVTALGTTEEGATLSEAGIWYSTISGTYDATDNPGTFVAASSPEVGTSFSVNLTDLNADKTYYVRAYAKNSVVDGYGFGEAKSFRYNPIVVTGTGDVSFTISGTNITATISGNKVSDKGASDLTEAGIWYSTSGDNYDANNQGNFVPASSIPAINADYSVGIEGMTPDQRYYVRAYAINANGTYFGEVCDVTFKSPKVTTKGVSYTNAGEPQVKGVVTDKGSTDAENIVAGIWYSEINSIYDATNPGVFQPTSSPTIGEEYIVEFTGLDASKTYYARAYVTYNSGTTYIFGEAVSFSKDNFVIVTGNITNITGSSATVSGMVMSTGAYTLNDGEVGIWWSEEGPTYDASSNQGHFCRVPVETTIEVGTEYTVELTGLQGYNQYVRAYAKVTVNSGGDGGGKDDPTYTYFFGNLTSIYANSPSVSNNEAIYGGGIYMTNNNAQSPTLLVFSGGNSDEAKGRINLNYADRAGGGIYIDEHAYMQMTGYCEVNGNHVPADSLGGGIYLAGRLYVGNPGDGPTDNSLKVNQNFAITDADFKTHYLNDQDGFTTDNKFKRNNIYLPRDTYSYATGNNTSTDDNSNVITLLADISAKNTTTNTYYSNMGFSVPNGYCPVITTAAEFRGDYLKQGDENFSTVYEPWMSHLMPSSGGTAWSTSALFDDSESHIAIHTVTDIDPFRAKYIFLWGSWTNPKVDEDPEIATGGINLMGSDASHKHYNITYTVNPLHPEDENKRIANWEILSPEGLSWFSSYVNGLNAFTLGDGGAHKQYDPDVNPYATAKLMNDIDMSAAFWVPLGSVTSYDGSVYHDEGSEHNFKGTFNGQGHIITGLDCRFLTGVRKYGLFGKLDGNAVVKNVFIDDSKYMTIDETSPYYVGGVAGILSNNATISASEARVVMDINKAKKSESYAGGLVGKMEGNAMVHSSMAMLEIHGVAKYVGGLVGDVGVTNKLLNSFSNPKFPETTYPNSIEVTNSGTTTTETVYFGGLVGVNNGLVENCYSRLQGNEPKNSSNESIFGWLAGTNTKEASETSQVGIRYCYAPTYKIVYVKNQTEGNNKVPFRHGNYSETERYSGKYGFKHRDHKMYNPGSEGTIINTNYSKFINAKTNDTLVGGLMNALNHWVDTANKTTPTYAKWTRTMASSINDDYPIPMLTEKNASAKFNSVGSIDSIYMVYEDDVNHMWTGDNGKHFDTLTTTYHPGAAMYLYDVQPGDVPADVEITGNVNVPLHIHEDIGITQPANAKLTARAGVTIKNARKGDSDFTPNPNWHLFSSAINDVPMGLEYHTDTSYSSYNYRPPYSGNMYSVNIPGRPEGLPGPSKDRHSHTIWSNRNYFDPPHVSWFQSDRNDTLSYNENGKKIGYFPTNTPYGTWRPGFDGHTSSRLDGFFDLYCYSEEFYHWINFKREGSNEWLDHWHMDADDNGDHLRLDYGYNLPTPTGDDPYSFTTGNEPCLLTGKGYMMALSSESMMMADGQLNTGDIYAPVTLTAVGTHNPRPQYRYDEPWRTLNLVGNPYQSYLDFVKIIGNANNRAKLEGDNVNDDENTNYTFAILDDSDDQHEYKYYTMNASSNPEAANRYIHPHQGFFVKVKEGGNLIFNNDMRKAGSSTSFQSFFRDDEQINYPLVNLICYEPSGHRSLTTVEVNRPKLGGGYKMKNLRTGNASIYARLENEDYQTLFTPVGTNTVPVWFETNSDDVYTLRWSTLHGTFSYLHLIDNLMGVDIDCLTTEEYRFEASVEDYKSRFKLVFRCDEEPDEPDEPDDPNESDHFAFMFGDELIVNGEGMLQMFDVQGRCLMTTRVTGGQSSVSLPKVASGVYLLRLIGNDKVKVQKMVIK